MAYNVNLGNRIREVLAELPNIEEKEMMGGLVFMYNGKMCVGIIKDEMMLRIDPDLHESLVEKPGCRTMDFTKRPMKGYVLIDDNAMRNINEFRSWIQLALDFNKKAKASKKKRKP
ncbi:MAG: TfoX/Sxy family protein [Bacteroidales bacterium]|nr:TfoX/Sxy family protein [Bacteroidales bacterium]